MTRLLNRFVPENTLVPLSNVTLVESRWSARIPDKMLVATKLVSDEPLALMVPAEKFPLASRLTSVFGVLALVAALAALAPLATAAAVCPPTLPTTVADWLPVTSPASAPEKLVAVLAEPEILMAAVPAARLAGFRLVKLLPLP